MTNIEEQFYKTFGIEPRYNYESCERCVYFDDDYCKCDKDKKYTECEDAEPLYPEITDRILVELIWLIINQNGHYDIPIMSDVNDLKRYILKSCTLLSVFDEFKAQVQSLFKGDE